MNKKIQNKTNWLSSRSVLIAVVLCFLILSATYSIARPFSSSGYTLSQKINEKLVTIVAKEKTLDEIMTEIRRQTQIDYGFQTNANIDDQKKFSLNVKNVTVASALKTLLEGRDLQYRIVGDRVIIGKSTAVQTVKEVLTGRVVDKNGNPIEGVAVAVKRSTVGTATNSDGNYKLTVSEGQTVVFSFVGMETQEIEYAGQKELNIRMKESTTKVDEVVVTGYQKLNKERSTGSFSTVNKEDLDKQLGALSIAEKFQSLIPGVLMNPNGTFTIRGKSTINANSDPIIVVDGFPIESSISTINPNDVESITVLKDAASASIWGVRASNGVIVITTRSGKEGLKPIISASAGWRVQRMPKIESLHLAGASDFVDYQLETLNNGWFNTTEPNNNFGYSRVWEIFAQKKSGQITEAQATQEYNKLRFNHRDNQKDLFYRTAIAQQYDLSISGGTNTNKYYISANYQNQDKYARGEESDIFKFSAKNSYKLHPKLTLDAAVNLSFDEGTQNGISLRDYLAVFPYMPFVDENGEYVYDYNITVSNEKNRQMMDKGYYDWRENLKSELDNNDNNYKDLISRFNVGFNYNFLKGFSWESRLQYELRSWENDTYYNNRTQYNRDMMNRYTILDAQDKAQCQLPRGLIYNRGRYDSRSYTFRNQINVDLNFDNSKHIIAAILGTEVTSFKTNSSGSMFMNWDRNKLTYSPFMSTEQLKTWNGYDTYFTDNYPKISESENRYFSLYANGSYTYDNRYAVSVSARLDESNLFGASARDRKTPLYSFGVAWNISNEAFFSSEAVNYLKIRATTGKNGNIDKKTSKELVARADRHYSTGENYLSIQYPANPDLKWETTTVNNIGVDFGFFDNRLNGSLEYYVKKSKDLLAFAPGDPSFGFKEIYRNTAKMKNSGFNFNVNATLIKTKDLMWDLSFHISCDKNRVTKVYSPSTVAYNFLAGLSGSEIEGRPLDYLYNYRYAGLTKEGEPQIYDDKGALHQWTEDDLNHKEWLVYSGSTTPPVYGAINTSLYYKGLTLNMIFNYKAGHVMRMPTTTLGSFQQMYDDIALRWRKPGDEANTIVPRLYTSNNSKQERNNFYRYSDRVTESASFIRVSNLSLSYDLPDKWLGNVLRNTKVYFQVSNLGFWAKNSRGLDPDRVSPVQGELSFETSPLYTFGINIEF